MALQTSFCRRATRRDESEYHRQFHNIHELSREIPVRSHYAIYCEHQLFGSGCLLRAATPPAISISFLVCTARMVCGSQRGTPMAFTISTSAFSNGSSIPQKFTCQGPDVSPQLGWTEPTPATK